MKNYVIALAVLMLAGYASAANVLEMTTPRGGEVFLIGQTQQVRVTGRFKVVLIDLSRDGGATFADVGKIENAGKDKSLQNLLKFTVTGPAATNCILRARVVGPRGTIESSSGGFVITAGNTLGPVIVTDLADGSVATPKLADGAVTDAKVGSGAASAGFLLTADGSGGADWAPLNSAGLDLRYVLKAGDTLKGALTLSGNPTANLHAASKQYVDTETTRAQTSEGLLALILGGEITRAQGVEGTLTTNLAAETTARTAAEAVLQNSIDAKVAKAGDTMTGTLIIQAGHLQLQNGHIRSEQTTAPTIAVSQPFGITAAALAAGATDVRGTITTTGTNNGLGDVRVDVTFNTAFSKAPVVTITAANQAASKGTWYVNATTAGFSLVFSAPSLSAPAFNYVVIE